MPIDESPVCRPSTIQSILRRIVFGILFVLPMLLTCFIVYQLYLLLNSWVINPVAAIVIPKQLETTSWKTIIAFLKPVISLLTVLLTFYFLGYAFQTRLSQWLDRLFGAIPGISILYRAIRDAARAMQGPDGLKNIDTVVLVPFPHPQARAAGFLMGESLDETTGTELACVYIPIALFPPSGYTLVFPRDQVATTQWEATTPWKLLLSGGLTIPERVPYSTTSAS